MTINGEVTKIKQLEKQMNKTNRCDGENKGKARRA